MPDTPAAVFVVEVEVVTGVVVLVVDIAVDAVLLFNVFIQCVFVF